MAAAASASLGISIKTKPPARPVSRASALCTRATWLNSVNSSRNSASEVYKLIFPTNKLVILILPVLVEAPRAQDLGEGPLPRCYETLAWKILETHPSLNPG